MHTFSRAGQNIPYAFLISILIPLCLFLPISKANAQTPGSWWFTIKNLTVSPLPPGASQPTLPPPGTSATVSGYRGLSAITPSETYNFDVVGTYDPLPGQQTPSNLLVEQSAAAEAPIVQIGSYSASGSASDGIGDSCTTQSSSTPYSTFFNAGSEGNHLYAAPGAIPVVDQRIYEHWRRLTI